MNRLLTEIKGAPFVEKMAGGSKASKKKTAGAGEEEATAVDVNELLQPKKKRKMPKRKAAPKSTAGPQESAADVQEEVVLGDADDSAAPTRPRWWVDDLLGCLEHAAGSSLLRYYTLRALCSLHNA